MLGASRSHAVHIFQIIHSRMMCQWQSSKTVASFISWDSMMFQWNLTCKKCIHIYFWTSIKSNTSHPYWNAFGISANDLQCGGAFDLIILGSFWLIRSSFTGVYKIYFSLKTFSIHTNHCIQSSLLRCIYFIPYSRHIPLMQDWSQRVRTNFLRQLVYWRHGALIMASVRSPKLGVSERINVILYPTCPSGLIWGGNLWVLE